MDYQSEQGVTFSPGINDMVKIILPSTVSDFVSKSKEKSLDVPIDSLLEYVAYRVRMKQIAALEQATVEQILGIEECP